MPLPNYGPLPIHGPFVAHTWPICGPFIAHLCPIHGPFVAHSLPTVHFNPTHGYTLDKYLTLNMSINILDLLKL